MRLKNDNTPPCLTISGSDSGGEAGIQADSQAFRFFGTHALTAITCATAQTPHSILSINPLPTQAVIDQVQSAIDFFNPEFIKTGLLYSKDVIDYISHLKNRKLIIDPLMISSSGTDLLPQSARQALKEKLLPKAWLITPNIPEAEELIQAPIIDLNSMIAASQRLKEMFNCHIYLKGGHINNKPGTDLFTYENHTYLLEAPEVKIKSSHGTGCRIASSLCANSATGNSLLQSAINAKAYTLAALENCTHSNSHWLIGQPQTIQPNNITVRHL